MKFRTQVSTLALVLVLVLPAALSQTLQRRPPSKQQPGMLGYALSKINPNDRDYGSELAEKRGELVGRTIDDAYFWSNCVTLALLGILGIWLVLLQRAKNKAEIIASHLIAQLWNGRVIDLIEIENRTRRYNEIVDRLNEATERELNGRKIYRKSKKSSQIDNEDEPEAIATETEHQDGQSIEVPLTPSNTESLQVVSATDAIQREAVPPKQVEKQAQPVATDSQDGEVVQLRKELEQRKQDARKLEGQVQALKQREKNLILRLNQSMEHQRQTKDRVPGRNELEMERVL